MVCYNVISHLDQLIYYLNLVDCAHAGSVRGEWKAWISYLIGSNKCLYATDKARECARKANQPVVPDTIKHARSSSTTDASNQLQKQVKTSQPSIRPCTYKLNDLPFSPTKQAIVQAQNLWAVISTNSAFGFCEDPEMQELFCLMCIAAPSVLPSGKPLKEKSPLSSDPSYLTGCTMPQYLPTKGKYFYLTTTISGMILSSYVMTTQPPDTLVT